ncbi:pilin [Leucothrix sargassi]|nr:pilin [Leucothrix sargassi]
MNNYNRQQGFTLIELMIVVAIIGILTSIATPSYLNYVAKTQWASGFHEISTGRVPVAIGMLNDPAFDPSTIPNIGSTENCDITAANNAGVVTISCTHKGNSRINGKVTVISRSLAGLWSCSSTSDQWVIGDVEKCTGQ